MSKKVCFLQVAHMPYDDRVWYHQVRLLVDNGYDVSVISTRINKLDLESRFYPSHKLNLESVFCFDDSKMPKKLVNQRVSEILNKITPSVIICDNPLAVYFASKYNHQYSKNTAKIAIDVTEWYPSKKNLINLNPLKKFFKKIILSCLNIYSGFLVDGFIFGEYHKAKMFKRYFGKKPNIYLPYYPDLKYINKGKTKEDFSTWKILFANPLTKEKGFANFINAMKTTALENQCYNFYLDTISPRPENEEFKKIISSLPNNVKIKHYDYLPFEEFGRKLGEYDLFFDLREIDKENNKCLPIKLFYYMASGKPVVFSNLEAIKLQVAEIEEFGSIVNPEDDKNISRIITEYIYDNDKYFRHCFAAMKYSEDKYNWESISERLLNFINELN